jgi:hypothetical protein
MKKPKPIKLPKGYDRCPDCGATYNMVMPHRMFCAARTCEECGCSSDTVLQEINGRRLCEECEEAV